MNLDKNLAKAVQDLMPECKEAVNIRFVKIKNDDYIIKNCIMVDFVIDFLNKLTEERLFINKNKNVIQDWKEYDFHADIPQEYYLIYICSFGVTKTIYMLQSFGIKSKQINCIEDVIDFLSLSIIDKILFEYQKVNKISDNDWWYNGYRVNKFQKYLMEKYILSSITNNQLLHNISE